MPSTPNPELFVESQAMKLNTSWEQQTNEYRLWEKPDGKLVLQRMFLISDGTNCGPEWRDQVTVTDGKP